MSCPEPSLATDASPCWGTVIAVQANYYQVRLDTDQLSQADPTVNGVIPRALLLCTRRSRLKKLDQQVMVGDRVLVEEPDWQSGQGAIAQVLPRQTELSRPPIANADQILLLFALAEPTLDPYQLSRFLVKAESTGLAVLLGLSKGDLMAIEQQQHWQSRLEEWGYQPLVISVYTAQGLAALDASLKNRITVLAGPSGVGKSSLINALIPGTNLRVATVSGKLGRGRHTTRHVELFTLPNGGFLADTPGFNQPDLDYAPDQLGLYFPEIRQRLQVRDCQFHNCLHHNEPNCAVRGNWERYDHYLSFLRGVQQQHALKLKSEPESRVKLKIKDAGQASYEPKLATKKYRRPSRRTQQQALQDLYQDSR